MFHEVKYTKDLPKDIFVIFVVALVAFGAFIIGRYSALEEKRVGELRITDSRNTSSVSLVSANKAGIASIPVTENIASATSGVTDNGIYVGSKSGKTYHLPWCSGAKRIHEKNQVWFASKEEAEQKGYKPSSTCKGI